MSVLDWILEFSGWIIFLMVLIVAYFTGSRDEKKHYASILEREDELRHIMIIPVKRPPKVFYDQHLVRGSVVVSSNAFTRFLAGFRNFFGGNVRSYETLLDRARREAILRMKAEAQEYGANMILNMKLETVMLGNIHDPRQAANATVEVLAYGTSGKILRKPKG
ncbi:YbjQ family protein [Neisseriaceae bacterium B1]